MTFVVKNIGQPDELRRMPKGNGQGAIVTVAGTTVVSGELQPGWRWSNDLRPVVGTTSCEFPHTGIMLSGIMHIEMDDGTSVDLKPGDVYAVPPGHDAWVVGDEPVRSVDWGPEIVEFAEPLAKG
jgi:hypothetical protein